MKVITKVVIDIETGEVLEEESYEYEGPIAECKGGGSTVTYQQSPEQKRLLDAVMPIIQDMVATIQKGEPLYEIPTPYEIPSIESLLPSTDWWRGITPEIKESLWAPWNEAADILTERLGAQAQIGSSRGGYSGAAGAALGKLYSEAGKDVGLQAWQMTQPAQQARWEAELAKGKDIWGTELSRITAPYQLLPSFLGSASQFTPTAVVGERGGFSPSAMLGGIGSGLQVGSLMAPAKATGLAALGGLPGLGLAAGFGLLGGLGGI